MNDDLMDLIRDANPFPDAVPAAPLERVLRRINQTPTSGTELLRSHRRVRFADAGVVLVSVTAVAAVVGVVLWIGRATNSPVTQNPASGGLAQATYRPLTSILGVLRRAQTSADRDPSLLRVLTAQGSSRSASAIDGKPVVSLVRLARIAPWGAKVFVVPYRPLTRPEIARLPRSQRAGARAERLGLTIESPATTSGVMSVAQITAGRALASPATGRSDRYLLVVPDGVARVALWSATSGQRSRRSAHAGHPAPIIVSVHGNVAAFRSQTFTSPRHEVWYGPNGKVIKRITNASSCRPPLGNCA